MKQYENEVINFIEPVYRFCIKRISNRSDAEDLASEIILYVLDGINKYEIKSFDAWVWRIAHNRYARFCEAKKSKEDIYSSEYLPDITGVYNYVDRDSINAEYEIVFRYLHTLSSEYKNVLVDYYIGGMSVRKLAEKYSLPETTVKWRLNVSRRKIKERIELFSKGENKMDKVYKRINWESTTCNGSMNASEYLSNQVARAICEAAYEKPLTIEEISLKTGLPTMYIEDALPHLIYGDAIEPINDKYAANFIILRLKDRERMEKQFNPLINEIAGYFENLFTKLDDKIKGMDFYGHDLGMSRLGYIALPYAIRNKVRSIKNSLPELSNGPFPPRKDGGYGWFIVEESQDENDSGSEYGSGCNAAQGEIGCIYWYHIGKYSKTDIYNNGGTRRLAANNITRKCINGIVPDGLLTEDELLHYMQINLIVKSESCFKLNFPCFTHTQFTELSELFLLKDERINQLLTELIINIKTNFKSFVPKRLESQINQWVSCFVHSITGYVTEELIERRTLEKPDEEKPFADGVFYIEGKYINV